MYNEGITSKQEENVKSTTLRRRAVLYGIGYALGFFVIALAHAWPFIRSGKYFVFGADGYTQMFPVFCYMLDYVKELLRTWLQEGFSFSSIPLYDFSLGLGGDILSTLNWHGFGNVFYLLALPVDSAKLPLAYSLILVLQYFLAGLAFWGFAWKIGYRDWGGVLGAWVYVFTGFYLMTVEHPLMAHAVFYLPLVLWGAEKILRRESPLLLALSVFFLALSGFYFLFITSVILAFYILIRVWQQGDKPYWKTLILQVLRQLAAYLSGLAMACVVFLPSVLGYLHSNRTGGARPWAQMLFIGWKELLQWFAQWLDPSVDWSVCGLCVLALAVFLAGPRKEGRERTALLAGLCLAAVFVICPLAQSALVGFGQSEYTRFWYGISFLLACLTAKMYPALFSLSRRQLLAGGAAVLLYGAALLACGSNTQQKLGLVFLAAFWLAAMAMKWAGGKKPVLAQKAGGVVLTGLVLCQLGLGFYKDAQAVSPAYRDGRFARQMPMITEANLPGATFRVDAGDVTFHQWWASSNAAMVGQYMGLSEYFSILREEYARSMLEDWALAPAQQGSFSFQSLDGCAALNTLASVRYVILREGEEAYLPYGYELVQTGEQSGAFTLVPENGSAIYWYENQYALPMGYTYDRYITEEEYRSLNGLQKQAALMHVLVTDSPAAGMEHADFAKDCGQQAVTQLEIRDLELTGGLSWQDGVLEETLGSQEEAITFRVQVPAGSEIHLELEDFEYLGADNDWVSFSMEGGWERQVRLSDVLNGPENWINLGYSEQGGDLQVTFFISEYTRMRLGGLQVWAYDMEDYAGAALERRRQSLQNTNRAVPNSLEGVLESETDTVLCLAVPYSEGWQATVDGAVTPLTRANGMFMQMEVPAGSHVIRIHYVTPGLKAGAVLSAAGFVALLAQLALYYKRKKRQKPAGSQ